MAHGASHEGALAQAQAAIGHWLEGAEGSAGPSSIRLSTHSGKRLPRRQYLHRLNHQFDSSAALAKPSQLEAELTIDEHIVSCPRSLVHWPTYVLSQARHYIINISRAQFLQTHHSRRLVDINFVELQTTTHSASLLNYTLSFSSIFLHTCIGPLYQTKRVTPSPQYDLAVLYQSVERILSLYLRSELHEGAEKRGLIYSNVFVRMGDSDT